MSKRKKRARKNTLKTPTLTELLNAPSPAEMRALMATMTLGELLKCAGLEIEVERKDATAEQNHVLTALVTGFRPTKHIQ